MLEKNKSFLAVDYLPTLQQTTNTRVLVVKWFYNLVFDEMFREVLFHNMQSFMRCFHGFHEVLSQYAVFH